MMFHNIDKKLKTFAKWYTAVCMIVLVVATPVICILGEENALSCLIACVISFLTVWANGAIMYGIGQVVENTNALLKKQQAETPEAEAQASQPAKKRLPWVCASCGTENLGHVPFCTCCNVSRDWSEAQKKEQ